MISTDMLGIETKFVFIFVLIQYPLKISAVMTIMYYRLGYWGIFCIAMMFIIFPIQSFFGNLSGKHYENRS